MRVPYYELDPCVRFMTEEERASIAEAVAGDGMVEISRERLNLLLAQVTARQRDISAKFAKFGKNNPESTSLLSITICSPHE